jgi:hypothetical protein
MKAIFILFIFLPFSLLSQSDSLELNSASEIEINLLTSIGPISILKSKTTIYLTEKIKSEMDKILGKKFLADYSIGVVRTSPNNYLILECRKIIKSTELKIKNKSMWSGGGFKGGQIFEHWIIAIDISRKEIFSKEKLKYKVLAKF